ncbi:CubicO group peptidase (beta-lactamase class C family) [Pedobacter cryoconitis]|uniref:serine hydrolase n=1 Tax=Pedobacter cryoconitis TaxID=188932 RepID=UPI00162110A6|nr:serine hydrolase [Pedobacter cryoconitis]MBB6269701.1 CubicO group peptidase (beta-lactamase class C family) [Pedobacter cryoconitis]
MKKINLIILLFLSLNTFAQNVNDKIKLFENDLNHWDKSKNKKWTLKERMAFYNTNAVSIVVIKDYKVEWVKAYGYADISEKKSATPQTLFQAASISKSINSLGILKLVEEGKLGLDSDINNYLKTWKFPYDSIAKGRKISISNLLSHMAGLSVGGFAGYEKGKDLPTTIETLNGLKPSNSNPVRSIFEPGLKFQYSGGGITITQLILENITGEKYEDYMKKNVLIPLGMGNSSFNQPPTQMNENILATGYSASGKEINGKYHIYPEKAAAGLWTNPTDLAKYVIETQLSLLGKSNKVLSQEISVKRIENNLGVFLYNFDGAKYFKHSGGNEGFVCHYIGSTEGGNGIVVMTNGSSTKLLGEIVSSIASLNTWKNYPLEPQKESISLTITKECYRDIDKGIELYKKLKKNNSDGYNFSNESELNMLGYQLLKDGKVASAIKILSLNVASFPNSANAYDSRGEAYFNKKEYSLSKKDYLKVLELDQSNQNAKEILLKIEKEIGK